MVQRCARFGVACCELWLTFAKAKGLVERACRVNLNALDQFGNSNTDSSTTRQYNFDLVQSPHSDGLDPSGCTKIIA